MLRISDARAVRPYCHKVRNFLILNKKRSCVGGCVGALCSKRAQYHKIK